MTWAVISESPTEQTERMAVRGGWLYRSAWHHRRDIGVEPLRGAALVFVPGTEQEKVNGEEEAAPVEVEGRERAGEQDGVAGQDHQPRRGREGRRPGREAVSDKLGDKLA